MYYFVIKYSKLFYSKSRSYVIKNKDIGICKWIDLVRENFCVEYYVWMIFFLIFLIVIVSLSYRNVVWENWYYECDLYWEVCKFRLDGVLFLYIY